MSHSGSQVIPKDGGSEGSVDAIIESGDHVQFVRTANDHELDIVRGLDAGKFSVHKFASNPSIPNGSFADIWTHGPTDPTYNWPSTTEKFRVAAGGNVADDAAGLGARTIMVEFLDGSGNKVIETLTLAGASASASTITAGRRIWRAWVEDVGTILSNNTGDIIIENETSGQVVAVISAGIGQTQMSMYTIPLGFTAYLFRIELTSATNKNTDIIMWQRRNAYVVAAPFGAKRLCRQWLALQGTTIAEFPSPIPFPELTDIWFEAKGNANVSSADVDYDLVCVSN